MFSVRQKRDIAEAVQQILRKTNHPELPAGEIGFLLHVACVNALAGRDPAALAELERAAGEIIDRLQEDGWNPEAGNLGKLRAALARFRGEKA